MVWIDVPDHVAKMFSKGCGGKASGKAATGKTKPAAKDAYSGFAFGKSIPSGKACGKGAGIASHMRSPIKGGSAIHGKGSAVKGGGGNLPSKRKPAQPCAPLDEDRRAQIELYIQESGGAIPFSVITSNFSGLKKQQVEDAGFGMASFGNGDYMVSTGQAMPSGLLGAVSAGFEPSFPTKKKVKKDPDAQAVVHASLDPWQVEEMRAYITEQEGSVASLGKMTSQFEGVKKAQVEEHFYVTQTGDGTFAVTLEAPSQKAIRNGGLVFAKAVKRERKPADPDAPPPPALTPTQVATIGQWLRENGGSASLGKLTSAFPGTKKMQLEMEVAAWLVGEKTPEQPDPVVTLLQ